MSVIQIIAALLILLFVVAWVWAFINEVRDTTDDEIEEFWTSHGRRLRRKR